TSPSRPFANAAARASGVCGRALPVPIETKPPIDPPPAASRGSSQALSGCLLPGAASFERLANPGQDPFAVREYMTFKDGAVGYRHLQGADPLHRGLEPREGRPILGGNGSDLRREAGRRPRLVGDDEATGFLHRVADRFRIERHQAARIDDLDRDPLGGKLFGRSERLVNEPGERDDGYVTAFAFDVGLAV